MTRDYLKEIRLAETPEAAATLVRAQACHNAVALTCYDDAQRIGIIEKAERLAESLERPYCDEDGKRLIKPWIQWLREAGY